MKQLQFGISNAEGVLIKLNSLDEEACALWNVEYNERYYAVPDTGIHITSWYDMIGITIATGSETSKWDDVLIYLAEDLWKCYIKIMLAETKEMQELLREANTQVEDFFKPYFQLIKHWESKGYKPVKL